MGSSYFDSHDDPSNLLGASSLLFFLNFGQVSVKYSTPRRLPNGDG